MGRKNKKLKKHNKHHKRNKVKELFNSFSLVRNVKSWTSNSILWYKTKEHDWIDAQEYYLKTLKGEKITVLKAEVND